MAWYSKQSRIRRRQVALDAGYIAWLAAWIALGVLVSRLISALAKPLRSSITSLEGVRDGVHDTAVNAGGLPVGAGQLRPPLDGITTQMNALIGALTDQVRAIEQGAVICGIALAVLPGLAWLGFWLPRRRATWRQDANADADDAGSRRADAPVVSRSETAPAREPRPAQDVARAPRAHPIPLEVDRAALRAVLVAPATDLVTISPDPVGDWRVGDELVIRRLADLDAALGEAERRGAS